MKKQVAVPDQTETYLRERQAREDLAAWDTENLFRTLAASGDVSRALAILDRLDADKDADKTSIGAGGGSVA